jgi:membrane protease YdiL (CAAX protease family)
LRLVTDSDHAAWLQGRRSGVGRGLVLSALAGALVAWLPLPNIWWTMTAMAAILLPLAIQGMGRGLLPLLAPSWPRVGTGLLAAALQYVTGAAVFALVASWPRLLADLPALHAQLGALPLSMGLLLLPFIIAAEEVIWRGAVTLPLAARLGPWPGVLAGAALCAGAHLGMGLPLLAVAAFAAGIFWGALAVRSRSLVPGIVCHLLWDVLVFYVRPY